MNDKSHMAKILYSPPYMPVDEDTREIWALLVELGFDSVEIIEYTRKKFVTFLYAPCPNSEWKKRETINLSWAFRELPEPLPLEKLVQQKKQMYETD